MTDVGPPTSAPQAPAPFYRLTIAVGDGDETFERFKSWWVPAAGVLLEEDGTWMAARPEVRSPHTRAYALPAARLPGFPAPTADVSPLRPAAAVPSDSGLPVVPLVAAVTLLALVGLLVRRHMAESRPSGALGSAE